MKNNRHNRNRVKMLFKSLGLPHKNVPTCNFHLTTFPKMRYSMTWRNNYLLGKGHLNVSLFHKYHRDDPTYKYFYK